MAKGSCSQSSCFLSHFHFLSVHAACPHCREQHCEPLLVLRTAKFVNHSLLKLLNFICQKYFFNKWLSGVHSDQVLSDYNNHISHPAHQILPPCSLSLPSLFLPFHLGLVVIISIISRMKMCSAPNEKRLSQQATTLCGFYNASFFLGPVGRLKCKCKF